MKKVITAMKKFLRSPCLEILALLVILLLITGSPALSDFAYDSGERQFDINNIEIPDYYLRQNAFYHYYENQNDHRLIITHNYFSNRLNRFNWEAPLFIYRSQKIDLIAGNQLSTSTNIFMDKIPFQGIRASTYFSKSALLAYWGNSANANNWNYFTSDLKDYGIAGLVYKNQLGRYSSLRAGIHSYFVEEMGGKRNYIYTASYASRPLYGLTFSFTVGLDDPGEGAVLYGDNSAFNWNFDYKSGRMRLKSSIERLGKEFGLPVIFNYKRGQEDQNHQFEYDFGNNLIATVNYQAYRLDNTDLTDTFIRTNTLTNKLLWKVGKNTDLSFGTRHLSNRGIRNGDLSYDVSRLEYFVSAEQKWDNLRLSLFLQRYKDRHLLEDTSGKYNSEQFLARYDISDNQQLALIYNNYRFLDVEVGGSSNNRNLGFRYRNEFPDDKGHISLNFSRAENYGPLVGIPTQTLVESASLKYKITPLMELQSSYHQSRIPGRREDYNSFRIALSYLLSEHSEISASYFSNPFEALLYIYDQPFKLKNVVSIQLRQSFGGPLNKQFQKRWRGKIKCRAKYFPAGNPEKIQPLRQDMKPVTFMLKKDSEKLEEVRTDKEGQALFEKIKPGEYRVQVDSEKLGRHLKIHDSPSRKVNLTPGRTRFEDFLFEAYSSAYVVAWNDLKGDGKLPTPYTGFRGVKIILDGKKTAVTDHNGVVKFTDLTPGVHNIRVDPESLPRGVKFSGDHQKEVDLAAGIETVVLFSLRGWGEIRGKVTCIPRGKTPPETASAANVPIEVDGRQVAITDESGSYRARVPAGSHVITAAVEKTESGTYFPQKRKFKIDVEPAQVVETDFTFAYYGKIKGQVFEMVNGKKMPLKRGGIVINFTGEPSYVYTDDEGKYEFSELKIGKYSVSIDPGYIPENYNIISPAEKTVFIESGAEKTVDFVIKSSSAP